MSLLVFPNLKGLTFPVVKKPIMATDRNRSVSGKVNALQLMSYPIWNWELPYSFLRSDNVNAEWQAILAFFLQLGGDARAFQFKDVDDYTVTAQGFGAGDGAATQFQLVRTLTGGGFAFVEPVFVPTTITEITVGGTPTTDYTQANGLVTFNAPPANGADLAWTGQYNWVCRFDESVQEFQKFADKFWDLQKITFSSEPI